MDTAGQQNSAIPNSNGSSGHSMSPWSRGGSPPPRAHPYRYEQIQLLWETVGCPHWQDRRPGGLRRRRRLEEIAGPVEGEGEEEEEEEEDSVEEVTEVVEIVEEKEIQVPEEEAVVVPETPQEGISFSAQLYPTPQGGVQSSGRSTPPQGGVQSPTVFP